MIAPGPVWRVTGAGISKIMCHEIGPDGRAVVGAHIARRPGREWTVPATDLFLFQHHALAERRRRGRAKR